VGKPDDIRTQHDPGGIEGYHPDEFLPREIWCYGTNGHLTFPTLGCIYIDKEGKARDVFGAIQRSRARIREPGKGERLVEYEVGPPKRGMFEEEELRELLRVIHTGSTRYGWLLSVVRMVNALQPLGKEKALAAVDEYFRVSIRPHRFYCEEALLEPPIWEIFALLRVLFEVPEDPGYMPPIYWSIHPRPQEDQKLLPRYPFLLLDDIPFSLMTAAFPGKVQDTPEHNVGYFRRRGQYHVRSKPLRPPDNPLAVLRTFEESYMWVYGDDPRYRSQGKRVIMGQLLRLIESVYPVEEPKSPLAPELAEEEVSRRWEQIVEEVSRLDIRWDEEKNLYTFRDGTHLPERPVKHYRREIWEPEVPRVDLMAAFGRVSEEDVQVDFYYPESGLGGPVVWRVYSMKDRNKVLLEAQVKPGMFYSNGGWELKEGEEIQVELLYGTESRLSPVLEP